MIFTSMGMSFGTPKEPSLGYDADAKRGDLVVVTRNNIAPYKHLSDMIGIVIEVPVSLPVTPVSVFLNPYKLLLGNRMVHVPANLVQNIA